MRPMITDFFKHFSETKGFSKRFWDRVSSGRPDECWPYIGKTNGKKGYGVVYVVNKPKRVTMGSHRAAWIMTFGNVDRKIFICHKCDNPICCNPNHLFAGTPKDNASDCSKKGRMHFGEKAGRAKLTSEKVRTIRQLFKDGESMNSLAKKFEVSHPSIRMVVIGRSWPHIS